MSSPSRPGAPSRPDAATAAIRPATAADLAAITAIAIATGQHGEFENDFPAYIRHLIGHGVLLVAEAAGQVAGYGGTLRIGDGADAISMLTDLFIDPAAHGKGVGRAILTELWADEPRRMTFSSQHEHALPLYTSFGTSAWWPLLYFSGEVDRVGRTPKWSVEAVAPELAADLERTWTRADRAADYQMWSERAGGASVIAGRSGRPLAVAAVGGPADEFGINHLAMSGSAEASDAAEAVLAILGWLQPPDGVANARLPGPHPAVRPLLAAGWRVSDFDLFMASEPDLIDPLRALPHPGLA